MILAPGGEDGESFHQAGDTSELFVSSNSGEELLQDDSGNGERFVPLDERGKFRDDCRRWVTASPSSKRERKDRCIEDNQRRRRAER